MENNKYNKINKGKKMVKNKFKALITSLNKLILTFLPNLISLIT